MRMHKCLIIETDEGVCDVNLDCHTSLSVSIILGPEACMYAYIIHQTPVCVESCHTLVYDEGKHPTNDKRSNQDLQNLCALSALWTKAFTPPVLGRLQSAEVCVPRVNQRGGVEVREHHN